MGKGWRRRRHTRTTPLGREVCHCELLVICTNPASVDRKKTSLYSRLVVESPKSLTLNLWTIDSGCPSKLQCVSKSLHLKHLAVKSKMKKKKKINVPENISRGNHFTAPDQNPKIADTEFLLHWSKNQIMFFVEECEEKTTIIIMVLSQIVAQQTNSPLQQPPLRGV